MKGSFRLLSILLFTYSLCSGQSNHSYTTKSKQAIRSFEKAAAAYDYRKYEEALTYLNDAIKSDNNFIEAHMMAGDVYTDKKDYFNAVLHYSRAIEIDPGFFPQNFYNLAKAEMRIENYESAKIHLDKILTFSKLSPAVRSKAEKMLKTCLFASEMVKHPVPFNPVNLGDSINSTAMEYLPMLTADEQTLVFTRMKPKPIQRQTPGGNLMEEDFFISQKINGTWQLAQPLGPPINTPQNEGGQCLAPDGKAIFYTGCDREEGIGSCDIYYSQKTGEFWSEPVNLGSKVNSKEWDSQPSISFDGTTIYFTSTRSGGFGGSDIWKSVKGPDGSWGTATNAGNVINTSGNENSPFIHTDNQTLYFSSNGHPGMGDADLFLSKKDTNDEWQNPVNLGYPLNTSGEEFSLFVSTSGKTGYFSSERLKGAGALDLFYFDMFDDIKPNMVSYVKGKVTDETTKTPLAAKFEIIDNETGQTVLSSVSDQVNGEFLVCLPGGKDYGLHVSKKGYLFYSDYFSCKTITGMKNANTLNIMMKKARPGEKVILKNIFFETNSFELKTVSYPELEKLILFLKNNALIKIEINGHTDNTGDEKSNMLLSEKRAKSVYDYLVKAGIVSNRLTYKGYGESKPIASNESPEGMAQNRRTEFSIVSLQ